jgi:Sulfotransferase family
MEPTQQDGALPPFFIVGAQRSGTTMLRLMLNRHPDLSVPFESGFVTDFFKRLKSYGDLKDADNARRLLIDIAKHPLAQKGGFITDVDAILSTRVENYADLVNAIFRAHARARDKARWGDKTPGYVTDLEVIWKLFPGCLVIHLVRDGRDVAISNQHIEWGIHSIPRAAEDWRWKTTLGHKVGTVLGDHYLELRYEDLILQTEPALRRVCDFLHVAFQPEMLRYHETGESEIPPDSLRWHRNSVRAPDASLVYAWKERMSHADRIIFEQVAGDALKLFGYEIEGLPSTWSSRLKNLYYATLQRW